MMPTNFATSGQLRIVILIIVMSLGAGFIASRLTAQEAGGREAPYVVMEAPDRVTTGRLNLAAVEVASTYSELPVLWLGEEFMGYELTEVVELTHEVPSGRPGALGPSAKSFRLVYGWCTPSDEPADGPSCVPPVQILISGPGMTPPPQREFMPEDSSEFWEVRGLRAIDTSSGTVIWLDDRGTTVTIHTNSEVRAAAIQELRTANAATMNIDPIGPGELLDEIARAEYTLR